jgi:hypothetical protein
LGDDPPALQQALQSGVERPVIDQELVGGSLLQELRNAVGVIGTRRQAAQDQDFECALQKLEAFR